MLDYTREQLEQLHAAGVGGANDTPVGLLIQDTLSLHDLLELCEKLADCESTGGADEVVVEIVVTMDKLRGES